ncbi:hypothetical protein SECTIM467_13 [Brevibacillus phage SecTim467]|uniref:Uncharacterized protein n=2 Tax=Jenstvirus jenst TaxID=1982225 RepID=A0A0K2CP56_9CAUD|nr:hypothetical protein AVV11_gp178 [Brevibacillus phage Jenst]ALA07143.1 hypothetical protein JENST_13 [Brevibacillus phage Jenst]ALA07513.1 hypothetical protein SECTIM467_13 [Brevibacillus phage SecTim467]
MARVGGIEPHENGFGDRRQAICPPNSLTPKGAPKPVSDGS